jgi:hypothetical protein
LAHNYRAEKSCSGADIHVVTNGWDAFAIAISPNGHALANDHVRTDDGIAVNNASDSSISEASARA